MKRNNQFVDKRWGNKGRGAVVFFPIAAIGLSYAALSTGRNFLTYGFEPSAPQDWIIAIYVLGLIILVYAALYQFMALRTVIQRAYFNGTVHVKPYIGKEREVDISSIESVDAVAYLKAVYLALLLPDGVANYDVKMNSGINYYFSSKADGVEDLALALRRRINNASSGS